MNGHIDYSHMVSQYLLTHSKTNNKGDIIKNWLFYDHSLTPTGGSGEFHLLSRLSTYDFLLPPNTFYGSKYNT